MPKPWVASGKFHCGAGCEIGDDVTVDVAEEVVLGDRCVVAPGTYFGGRRVTVGDDFYGYDWSHQGRALDVGRGRRDDEDAVFTVGARCTLHDNRIDLARAVTLGDDVGLSPEVVVYTHGYWLGPLDGHPCRYEPVTVGDQSLVGFRSALLAGARVGSRCVVGAGSVVPAGVYKSGCVYAGNPAQLLKQCEYPGLPVRAKMLDRMMEEYARTCDYRGFPYSPSWDYPVIKTVAVEIDVERLTLTGKETEVSDDLRWFLFTRGIKIFTKRRFRKLPKR